MTTRAGKADHEEVGVSEISPIGFIEDSWLDRLPPAPDSLKDGEKA